LSRARATAPDLLRGTALLGIGLVNVPLQAGLDPTSLPAGTFDSLGTFTVALLVQGNAFVLFSLLFGWSFGTALASAERRGIAFGRRHARRMLALAAPSLAVLYALAVALLVERGLRARPIAAAGCLSATGYVAQGALADWIFGAHGLAVGGRVGMPGAVLVGFGIGTIVIAGCSLWRRRLGRGPLEAMIRRVSGA